MFKLKFVAKRSHKSRPYIVRETFVETQNKSVDEYVREEMKEGSLPSWIHRRSSHDPKARRPQSPLHTRDDPSLLEWRKEVSAQMLFDRFHPLKTNPRCPMED